jgi:nitroreductase
MNSTLETIARRRSVRAYADRALTREEKDAILNAAMRATTAGNMMLYAILEIEDQQLKERLAETCDHQPFIARAPYVLIFLADYQRWYDVYVQAGVEARCAELGKDFRKPQEGDLMLACADAIIAAQNAVVAAESMGIGSCYIGDIMENYEIHRELLGFEQYTFPAAMLCFGYPADPKPSVPQVKRFDSRFIVHTDRYRRLSEAEIVEMMQPLEERLAASFIPENPARNVGQANYLRKFGADFSYEMSRSVREMLKNWKG